jgi:hypothetical protein
MPTIARHHQYSPVAACLVYAEYHTLIRKRTYQRVVLSIHNLCKGGNYTNLVYQPPLTCATGGWRVNT